MSPAGTRPAADALERTVSVNLSRGGMSLCGDLLYPVGTVLFCSVSVPWRTKPIEAIGSLVWFRKVNGEAQEYQLGIEFSTLSEEHRHALHTLLAQPPATHGPRAKRLLLVDDDAELCLAMKLRFESVGFEVITAAEGLEALRKGRETHPNVIVLDLMLPKLNGYEVCRLLKFDQKFRHIPIILCTARCRREDQELGLAAGADAYVTKPFTGEKLIATVQGLLQAVHP